jgi:hypothetical protein
VRVCLSVGVGPKGAALLKKTSALQNKLTEVEKELQKVSIERDALSQSFKSESQVHVGILWETNGNSLQKSIEQSFNY